MSRAHFQMLLAHLHARDWAHACCWQTWRMQAQAHVSRSLWTWWQARDSRREGPATMPHCMKCTVLLALYP